MEKLLPQVEERIYICFYKNLETNNNDVTKAYCSRFGVESHLHYDDNNSTYLLDDDQAEAVCASTVCQNY